MTPELFSLIALAVLFTIGTVLRINIGALALVATFGVGMYIAGLTMPDLLAYFPADMFTIILGTTLLLGVAQMNGTVDWIVEACIGAVRGRVALLPWMLFLISALMSTLGPGAVPILAGIGAKFITRYQLNPVLIGLMVVHGAQAGAFSPITAYGVIVNGMMERFELTPNPWLLYACVLVFNTVTSIVGFAAFGGKALLQRRDSIQSGVSELAPASVSSVAGATGLKVDPRGAVSGGGGGGVQQGTGGDRSGAATRPRTQTIATETRDGKPAVGRPSLHQLATMVALAVFVGVLTVFQTDLGFTALIIAIALLLISPSGMREKSLGYVAWPTILLITGVLTYVQLLQEMGTITWVSDLVSTVSTPLIAVLICCYIGAAVSSVASSFGIIGILIPLVLPFLQSGEVSVIGTVAAVAICSTIVDVSPFSTYGALVLANSHGVDTRVYERKLIGYTGWLILFVPPVAWGVLVVPGWLP